MKCLFIGMWCICEVHLTLFSAACTGCLLSLKMEMITYALFEALHLSSVILLGGEQQMCYNLVVFLFNGKLPHPRILQREGQKKSSNFFFFFKVCGPNK